MTYSCYSSYFYEFFIVSTIYSRRADSSTCWLIPRRPGAFGLQLMLALRPRRSRSVMMTCIQILRSRSAKPREPILRYLIILVETHPPGTRRSPAFTVTAFEQMLSVSSRKQRWRSRTDPHFNVSPGLHVSGHGISLTRHLKQCRYQPSAPQTTPRRLSDM